MLACPRGPYVVQRFPALYTKSLKWHYCWALFVSPFLVVFFFFRKKNTYCCLSVCWQLAVANLCNLRRVVNIFVCTVLTVLLAQFAEN